MDESMRCRHVPYQVSDTNSSSFPLSPRCVRCSVYSLQSGCLFYWGGCLSMSSSSCISTSCFSYQMSSLTSTTDLANTHTPPQLVPLRTHDTRHAKNNTLLSSRITITTGCKYIHKPTHGCLFHPRHQAAVHLGGLLSQAHPRTKRRKPV